MSDLENPILDPVRLRNVNEAIRDNIGNHSDFDRLTKLGTMTLKVPACLVTLITGDCQEFVAASLNPVVTEMGVRSYLGFPLMMPNGQVLGGFCAIDFVQRNWTADEIDAVREFADRKSLFHRYVKLSACPTANETSTGLGLSIAKRLAHQHGGSAELLSLLGESAEFEITFPVA